MKYNKQNTLSIIIGLACLTLCFAFNSCKKMDASYSQYMDGGEIIYVHKADSLKLYPGQNRVRLSWLLGNDTRVKRAMIYWNNRTDSMEYIIQRTPGVNAISIIVPNLKEGSYTFNVITYDDKGHTSIKTDVSGNVYGNNYVATLENRKVKESVFRNPYGIIKWNVAPEGATKVEITYKDNLGVSHTVIAPATEATTLLENYKSGSDISYRTQFSPDSLSIDSFFSPTSVITAEVALEELDKSKFSRWNPVGLPYTDYGAGYKIELLWDNVYTGYGFMFNENKPLPSSYTFDTGQLAVLKTLKLNSVDLQPYKNGNVKKFQVWASATPNVNSDFSTWTFLGEFNSFKPSGLPLGQGTPEDLAYLKAGEVFNLITAPPMRYIRIVVQETWSPTSYKNAHTAEMTFRGYINF